MAPYVSPRTWYVSQEVHAPSEVAAPAHARRSNEERVAASQSQGADAHAGGKLRIDVHINPEAAEVDLRTDARIGLSQSPKSLPPKWFYDERGSRLFDEITRTPEYYPTRAERTILRTHAPEIVACSGADTLAELGSGTSEKTRIILDALRDTGRLTGYAPFDVSEQVLRDSAAAVRNEYPGVRVHGIVGDFGRHLELLPPEGRRMIAFLGSTIGNYESKERHSFLQAIADSLDDDETFLVGIDLVKEVGRLEAAYSDTRGVTAAFNRNVLAVLNRMLDANFVPELFAHEASWDTDSEWIEMRLRAGRDMTVHVGALGMDVRFAEGELMRTEVSAKFRRELFVAELEAAGMQAAGWWTDPAGDFALVLARPGGAVPSRPRSNHPL